MAYIKEIRQLVGHRPLIMTSASGALLNKNNAVLLQARADTGDWGFPGGYMEFGERFAETVQREFKEDAGLAVVPVKFAFHSGPGPVHIPEWGYGATC